jgi:diguanylate cyclase (GGDEF)-like protein/PAS domain S-box-containing protein
VHERSPAHAAAALLAASLDATDVPVIVAAVPARSAAAQTFPVVHANPAAGRVIGVGAEELRGRDARVVLTGDAEAVPLEAVGQRLRGDTADRWRMAQRRSDGTAWWADVRVSPVRDEAGRTTHVVAVLDDVTDQVDAEERSAHAATHDWLTGLANRAHFTEQLEREMSRASRDGRSLAVLFLDIDRFKATNDAHGHAVGDALLVETAQRLRGRLRGQDLAARHGGDEFLVLLVDLPREGAASAAVVAADIAEAVAGELVVGGTVHRLGVSIGVALYPRDAASPEDLVAAADAAMYREKANRRSS